MIKKSEINKKYISFLIIYLFIYYKIQFFLYYFPVKSNGFERLQGEDDERNIKRNKGKHQRYIRSRIYNANLIKIIFPQLLPLFSLSHRQMLAFLPESEDRNYKFYVFQQCTYMYIFYTTVRYEELFNCYIYGNRKSQTTIYTLLENVQLQCTIYTGVALNDYTCSPIILLTLYLNLYVFLTQQVLKLYAWEESFEKQINEIREKETGVIRKQASIGTYMHLTWCVTPFLVSIFKSMSIFVFLYKVDPLWLHIYKGTRRVIIIVWLKRKLY